MSIFGLVLTGLLVLLNAFFVIAEYSLVRSRRSRLEEMREQGARGIDAALKHMNNMSDTISACQVGITMTSIGIGAVGERVLAGMLKGPLGSVMGEGLAIVLAATVSYLLITSAHITVGEIVPKLYAIGHAERVLRTVARPLALFQALVRPLAYVLTKISHGILRLLGQNPKELEGGAQTSGELKLMIAESLEGGELDENEAGMLAGVFHLHEQEARQVMTPIPSVDTADVDDLVGDAMKRCIAAGHTRLLVIEDGDRDRVRGIVHASKLAERLLADGPDVPIAGLEHEPLIVPETKPLDDLLADLQRERTTLAVVMDEYGRTAGIVTVEDIVEEIVGEIDDETDPAGGPVRALANGDLLVKGEYPVADLAADHGVELPEDPDAYTSVGGLVFSELGRRPHRGDTVNVDGHAMRVEAMRDNRIESVRVRPPAKPVNGSGSRDDS
ncbi:MAG: hemolysin family protein [Actinomycetes bacterium]